MLMTYYAQNLTFCSEFIYSFSFKINSKENQFSDHINVFKSKRELFRDHNTFALLNVFFFFFFFFFFLSTVNLGKSI